MRHSQRDEASVAVSWTILSTNDKFLRHLAYSEGRRKANQAAKQLAHTPLRFRRGRNEVGVLILSSENICLLDR
jgi:hypothetical protein